MSVSMRPTPAASNPGILSHFCLALLGEISMQWETNLQAVRDKIRDGKLGFEATSTTEDELSKSVPETSGFCQ